MTSVKILIFSVNGQATKILYVDSCPQISPEKAAKSLRMAMNVPAFSFLWVEIVMLRKTFKMVLSFRAYQYNYGLGRL